MKLLSCVLIITAMSHLTGANRDFNPSEPACFLWGSTWKESESMPPFPSWPAIGPGCLWPAQCGLSAADLVAKNVE